jgi:hypothetical protein
LTQLEVLKLAKGLPLISNEEQQEILAKERRIQEETLAQLLHIPCNVDWNALKQAIDSLVCR